MNHLNFPRQAIPLIIRFSILMLVLNLAGCAFWGPDYEKPNDQAAAGWHSKDDLSLMGAEKLPEMAWWEKFQDPLLSQLVDKALAQNNNIQSAIGTVYKAKAILLQIEMRWAPQLDAGIGFMSPGGPPSPTTGASIPTPGSYTMGLIPNYAINIMEQLRTQEAAEANVEATVAAKNAVRLVVISQVVGSYFGLREEQYRLQRQKMLVESLEGILAAFSDAHREGYISEFVLQEYRLNLARAKAEIPVIEYNIVRLGNAIHVLLNENPGGIPDGLNFMDFKSTGIISGNLPSQVLKNRPDVIQAEAVVKQSNAQIGVATSIFFPTINLTTPIGYTSTSLTNLFKGNQSYWQYQGGITMPVLNLGAFGAIKAAKGQYYADFFNYVETVKNAFASVDSDLASHDKYTKSFDEMVSFYTSTNSRYEYESLRFREGLVAKPDVLTLNVKMNEAAISMAERKLDQLMSIVRLYQDLGGGYMYKNNEDAKDLGNGRRFNDLF